MHNEHYIQNQIRLWCGQHGYIAFRCNVGKVLTAQNTYFDTGLPSGFSDLLVLGNHGDIYFVECKAAKGKQRPDQIKFQQMVEERGFKYILANSVEKFQEKLLNYS